MSAASPANALWSSFPARTCAPVSPAHRKSRNVRSAETKSVIPSVCTSRRTSPRSILSSLLEWRILRDEKGRRQAMDFVGCIINSCFCPAIPVVVMFFFYLVRISLFSPKCSRTFLFFSVGSVNPLSFPHSFPLFSGGNLFFSHESLDVSWEWMGDRIHGLCQLVHPSIRPSISGCFISFYFSLFEPCGLGVMFQLKGSDQIQSG